MYYNNKEVKKEVDNSIPVFYKEHTKGIYNTRKFGMVIVVI